MKVELTPDAAQWVEASVAAGRFVTAEDAVRWAIARARRAELRAMLAATEAEGGSHSTDDVRRHVRDQLDRLERTGEARPPWAGSPACEAETRAAGTRR